jgi:hypothetical protein
MKYTRQCDWKWTGGVCVRGVLECLAVRRGRQCDEVRTETLDLLVRSFQCYVDLGCPPCIRSRNENGTEETERVTYVNTMTC